MNDSGHRLLSLRSKIKKIDLQVLKLIAQRMAVAEQIGRTKAEFRIPIENAEQERAVMNTILVAAEQAALPADDVTEIFLLIISLSKKMQGAIMKKKEVKSGVVKEEIIHGLGYWTRHGFTSVPDEKFTEAEIIAANGGSRVGAGYTNLAGENCELPSYYRRWSKWCKTTTEPEE
ncbi:MAG: chorismate mutase [Patescibacteria group bacterium]